MPNWGRVMLGCVFAAGPMLAQSLIDAATPVGKRLVQEFEFQWNQKSSPKLQCSIRVNPPRLNFDFQVWSGFELLVPWEEFEGRQRPTGVAIIEIQEKSASAKARYIIQRMSWPAPDPEQKPRRDAYYGAGFGYLLGKGTYEAKLLVSDSDGRVCRKDWKISVKPGGIEPALEPGQISLSRPAGRPGLSAPITRGKATLLLRATPFFYRRYATRLSPWDRVVLLTALSGFASRSPYAELRVVVYDLMRRKVLFETETLNERTYDDLDKTLRSLNLGTIEYQVLKSGPSEMDFLTSLAQTESERNPEALVFIGPARIFNRRDTEATPKVQSKLPPSFHIALSPDLFISEDAVATFVKSISGKILHVHDPVEFSKAIDKIRNQPQ